MEVERKMETQVKKQKLEIEHLKKKGEMSDRAMSTVFKKLQMIENEMKEAEERRVASEMEWEKTFERLVRDCRGERVTSPGTNVKIQSEADVKGLGEASTMENSKGAVELEMNLFNLEYNTHHFQPSLRWTIDGFWEKIKDMDTFRMLSPEFDWIGYPIRARAQLELKENEVIFVSLDLRSFSRKYQNNLEDLPEVFYLLRFRDGSAFPVSGCCSYSYGFERQLELTTLRYSEELGTKSECSYPGDINVEDVAVIEVYVQPSAEAEKALSYDGTLDGIIRNLYDSLPEGNTENDYAHDFIQVYTGPRGYKIEVYFEKHYQDDSFRAVVSFAKGRFDRDLDEYFDHRTTITLIHAQDAEKNVTKSVERRNKDLGSYPYYEINMISWADLHLFLTDGSLRFQLAIEAI